MFLPHFTTAKNVYIIKQCQNEKTETYRKLENFAKFGALGIK